MVEKDPTQIPKNHHKEAPSLKGPPFFETLKKKNKAGNSKQNKGAENSPF